MPSLRSFGSISARIGSVGAATRTCLTSSGLDTAKRYGAVGHLRRDLKVSQGREQQPYAAAHKRVLIRDDDSPARNIPSRFAHHIGKAIPCAATNGTPRPSIHCILNIF